MFQNSRDMPLSNSEIFLFANRSPNGGKHLGRVLLKVVNFVVDVDVNVDFTSEFTCTYRTFY